MKQFEDRGLARLGFIVPVSNSNLEPDMVAIRPDGVSVHFMRAGGYDLDEIPDSDQMRKFAASSLDPVMEALCAVQPDVIAYGCTSATLSSGPLYDVEFCQKMEEVSKVPAVTAAGALVEALRDINGKKVSFASPYTEQLNHEGADFLTQSGFNIVDITYVGSDLGNYGQGGLSPQQVFELGMKANHDDAEAIVLSCTDMRAVEIIERLESETGKTVITSNQAIMYLCCKRLGLKNSVPGKLSEINTVLRTH